MFFFGCVVKSWCCFPIDICRETSFKIVQLILKKKKLQAASAALEAGKRRKALAKSVASTSASGSASSVPSSDGSGGKRTRGEVLATPSTKVTPDAKVTCERGAVVTPCALNFDENTFKWSPPWHEFFVFKYICNAYETHASPTGTAGTDDGEDALLSLPTIILGDTPPVDPEFLRASCLYVYISKCYHLKKFFAEFCRTSWRYSWTYSLYVYVMFQICMHMCIYV